MSEYELMIDNSEETRELRKEYIQTETEYAELKIKYEELKQKYDELNDFSNSQLVKVLKENKELEKENARFSKMLKMAIDFIEQEDMQCKLCSFYFSCRENCPYGDETPISDIIRAELEKRVENEK